MPTYWITAHVQEVYIVEASNEEAAKEMVRIGAVTSRGDEIAEITIDYVGDNND